MSESLEYFSIQDAVQITEAAGIEATFDPKSLFALPQGIMFFRYWRWLNARTAHFISERSLERSRRTKAIDPREWRKFLKKTQNLADKLLDHIGNADLEIIRKFEFHLETTGYDVIEYEYKFIRGAGLVDLRYEDAFEPLLALRHAASTGMAEATGGKPGRPPNTELDSFVMGLAIEFQRLSNKPFTFDRYKNEAGEYEPLTSGHRFVCAVIDHIKDQIDPPVTSTNIATAAERAVSTLREMDRQRANFLHSGKLDGDTL